MEENTNFLVDSIIAGGFPSITIGLVLIVMSIASAAAIITETLRVGRAFWTLEQSIDPATTPDSSVWGEIRRHVSSHSQMTEIYDADLLSKIDGYGRVSNTILASIGANAPYIGLLGTVIGVYGALERIGEGAIDMADVAPPVGEALAMTAIGLLVAIPAVIGYNFVSRGRIKLNRLAESYCRDLRIYGHDAQPVDREIHATIETAKKFKGKKK